jgi:hypothetical protein
VLKLTKDELKALDNRPEDEYKRKHALSREHSEQPVLGQSQQLSLMPFQVIPSLLIRWNYTQNCFDRLMA